MPDAFATQRRRPSDPATFVFDITPDDANDLAHVTTALNVHTPGLVRVTTFDDWRKLDRIELQRGESANKTREKICEIFLLRLE